MPFDKNERYARQMTLPGFGSEGQARLAAARVAIVGIGGLGTVQAQYLAAAGVGRLLLIDPDEVAVSNLNRQILHWEEDLGRAKVDSAREKLARLNGQVRIEVRAEALTTKNAGEMLHGMDLVLDALDNLAARKVLNQACVRLGIPFIYGGIHGLEGMVAFIRPGVSGCLECLFPGTFPSGVFPVLGSTPGVIGCIQATEALKYLAGLGRPLAGRLLVYNGLDMTFREVVFGRDKHCPVCGGRSEPAGDGC